MGKETGKESQNTWRKERKVALCLALPSQSQYVPKLPHLLFRSLPRRSVWLSGLQHFFSASFILLTLRLLQVPVAPEEGHACVNALRAVYAGLRGLP